MSLMPSEGKGMETIRSTWKSLPVCQKATHMDRTESSYECQMVVIDPEAVVAVTENKFWPSVPESRSHRSLRGPFLAFAETFSFGTNTYFA